MFEQMRRNTKTIIWITVIAFVGLIFLAWGADFDLGGGAQQDPGVIGRVNGQPIYWQTYEQLIVQARANYQQQSGRDVDERTDLMIRNQVWDELIQEMLLRQEAERRGIQVTDSEIVQAILSQPPPEIVQNPAFHTEGRFDLAKYQAALRDPNVDTRPLEMQYRSALPIQKLQMQVVGSVAVSDQELWESWRAQNERARISYVSVPSSRFTVDEGAIGADALDRHYRANQSEYRLPAQAVVQYVTVLREHTEQDSLDLIEQAQQVFIELGEGEPFEILVDAYSEAPPTMRGGESAAWLGANQIPESVVREAAFSLPVGEVSGILVGSSGIHVIRVEDRRTDVSGEQVRLADIFLPLKPTSATLSQLREQVYNFRQEVNEQSFEAAAAQMNLTVRETAPFTATGFVPGLGQAPDIQEFAFSATPGAVSVPVERTEGWVVARLKERRAERIPELGEVQDRVRTEVADSLRTDQALAVAENLLAQARAGAPLSAVAETNPNAVHGTTEPFARLGFPTGIGSDPKVIGPVFASEPGLIPHVLRGRTGAFVVVVEEKIPADRVQFESQLAQQRINALQRRQNQLMTEWLAEMKKQAKIQDFRFGFYES